MRVTARGSGAASRSGDKETNLRAAPAACPPGSSASSRRRRFRVVLLENGTVTARPDGPPMNALLTDGFAGHLREIIGAAGATAAGIGLPGVRQHDEARRLGETLTRQTGCLVHVTGDADSARAGAFLGAPGVVVIAGTGSAAFGWNGRLPLGRAVTGSCSATRAVPTGSAAPPSAPRCAGKTRWAVPS